MNANLTPLLLAALLGGFLTACGPVRAQDSSQADAPETSTSEETRAVRAVAAEAGALSTTRSASVTIEPAQDSQVAAGTSGQVASIVAQVGSSVAAGDTVVRLDATDLQLQVDNARIAVQSARINLTSAQRGAQDSTVQAQNALRSAQTGLDLAQQQFEQGQRLFDSGGIAQTELTQLRAQLESAQATFQQAQDALAQAERAPSENLELLRLQIQQAETQLLQAERALAEADIAAPYTGEVAEVLVEQGEFIGAGSPAFRLVSSEEQLARFSVPVQDASRLQEVGQVWVSYNGLDYAAQIVRTSQVPGQTRLVEVTARLYPSENRIPTGTVTQLDYELTLAQGIKLPSGAVQTSAGQSYVLVVSDGVSERQTVNVVNEAGDEIIVRGLEPGTQVVYPVPSDLRSGVPVDVLGSQP